MATPEESSEQLSPAVEAFAEFLALHEEGESPDFEAFCARHEQYSPKLRRLHARWRELTFALTEGADGSLSERIERRFGAGCNPAISLDKGKPGLARVGRSERYEVGERIALGGMGEIRRVWDADLRRTLAMKVLLSEKTDSHEGERSSRPRSDPRTLSRFLAEAQITAQLEHPGIVPVHDLGLDQTGRVYFTMSLIRGRSLKEILQLAKDGKEGWNRTRALGVLLRVCEAVAFAHSKRVVHRDLKPANVMVGRFGETYVVDWGLARVLDREDHADIRLRKEHGTSLILSSVQSWRQDAAHEEPDSPLVTMDGDVVGTPVYMAPEQARGEVERVGPQADVYSIGAILYQLLTGEMPYVSGGARVSSRTLLARVIDGPPRPVRKIHRELPVELCSICDKAMARHPEDRYPDVLELAEDLRAFLEVRVVRAHATGAWAELKKWVSRNKGLSIASAAAVLALVLGLVASLVEKSRADEQTARAEANFALAFDAVDRMLTRVGNKSLADVPQMDAVRKDLLRDALELNLKVLESQRNDPAVRAEVARSHQRVALLHWKLGEYDRAEAAQRKAIAAFDSVARDNPGNPHLQAERIWARNALATYALSRGRNADGQALLEQVLDGLNKVITNLPGEPLHIERRAVVFSNLAVAHHRQGRNEEAARCAEQALAIREELALEHKGNPLYRLGAASQCINVGYMYERLQRYDDAEAVYQKGIGVLRELLQAEPGKRSYRENLGKLLSNLGIVQMNKPAPANAKAVQTLTEAVAINRGLLDDFSNVPAYHGSLGGSLSNLGQALRVQDDLAAARLCLKEAIQQTRIANAASPEDPQHRQYLANQYPKLCEVLIRLKQHRELADYAAEYASLEFVDPPSRWSRTGTYLAVCAALARSDKRLTPEESARLSESYGSRAVEMLRSAVDVGWLDAKAFDHRNFDALRDREDFKQLRAAVERGGRPR